MKTLLADPSRRSLHSSAPAKAALIEGFEKFLEKLSLPMLAELAEGEAEQKYFDALRASLSSHGKSQLSPKVRNQLAYAQGKTLALNNIKEAYELLDSKTVCSLLGISRQALNKRVQHGQVLAYTEGVRKHYPAFQFEGNEVMPEIARLVKAVQVEPKDDRKINVLLGFLAESMDYSNEDEQENIQFRYRLVKDAMAFEIIVRDFFNRLSMGK